MRHRLGRRPEVSISFASFLLRPWRGPVTYKGRVGDRGLSVQSQSTSRAQRETINPFTGIVSTLPQWRRMGQRIKVSEHGPACS